METDPMFAPAPPGTDHRVALAELVEAAASALQEVQVYNDVNDLPEDIISEDNGFPFTVALEDQIMQMWLWAEALRGKSHPISMLARCGRCRETFNPAGRADLIHLVREDGTECGGFGALLGEYK